MVTICDAFYSAAEILDAKKELYDLIGDQHKELQFKNRRGENPSKTNLEDMIHAMNKCDNLQISLPTFLSSNFVKVPQGNDGSVTMNQIMFMLANMKKQIEKLTEKSDRSSNDATAPVLDAEVNGGCSGGGGDDGGRGGGAGGGGGAGSVVNSSINNDISATNENDQTIIKTSAGVAAAVDALKVVVPDRADAVIPAVVPDGVDDVIPGGSGGVVAISLNGGGGVRAVDSGGGDPNISHPDNIPSFSAKHHVAVCNARPD